MARVRYLRVFCFREATLALRPAFSSANVNVDAPETSRAPLAHRCFLLLDPGCALFIGHVIIREQAVAGKLARGLVARNN